MPPRIGPAIATRAVCHGVAAGVLDVRAEEGDEDRPRRVEALAPRLDEVAHLVEEDQHDDAEREPPAPDQRVAAEGDEDRAELRQRPSFASRPRSARIGAQIFLSSSRKPDLGWIGS